MNKEERKIYEEAISKWGKGPQTEMIIEECSELITELSKLIKAIQKDKRKPTDETTDHLHEEIADVIIMIEQAQIIRSEEKINNYKSQKIERLKMRLNKSTKK